LADGKLGDDVSGWRRLSRPDEEKMARKERASLEAAEHEMSFCTFRPGIGASTNVAPKFLEAGYERFQNQKKYEKPKEPEPQDDKKQSGPGSPRRNPFRLSKDQWRSPTSPRFAGSVPQSPLNAYRNNEDAPGAARGEGVHVARARAAREAKAAKEAAFSKLGLAREEWKSRRSTTNPVPFASHTGLRKMKRKQVEEERALERSGEADKLFKELHEQLHSLELGGPPGWLS